MRPLSVQVLPRRRFSWSGNQLRSRFLGLALFISLTALFAGGAGAGAGQAPSSALPAGSGGPIIVWLPASAPAGDLPGRVDLYYDGLAGRMVAAGPDMMGELEERGGSRIPIGGDEALYVFLVRDASVAEFMPPARVLLRAGHEVVLATPGASPWLTAQSAQAQPGLRQPLRIWRQPVPWPVSVTPPPVQPMTPDPLIQQMINSITAASYHATWQTLDDFETRYAYTAQNEQASQWILDRFHAYGLSAAFHYFNDGGQRRNVIATLPGLVDPSKVVYITGHFDSISDTPNQCAPGADDDASGSNAVLEAARVLSQYPFQYTIKFACFNEEEQGMVGSAAYVTDIANQGENVIGVFDCDMLAYRGTDPAPPDLVIYTNSASQSLATAISNAIATYEPGLLEPVVTVSGLEGSDYASFWHHNYKAVCSIEDEAWADDFCPWYHSCNDRIEQYPTDYALYCTRANVAALAATALPLNPSGPFLVMGSSRIDDDNSGGSHGNGDGQLNPGETIELYVTVRNVGEPRPRTFTASSARPAAMSPS